MDVSSYKLLICPCPRKTLGCFMSCDTLTSLMRSAILTTFSRSRNGSRREGGLTPLGSLILHPESSSPRVSHSAFKVLNFLISSLKASFCTCLMISCFCCA